MTEIVLKNISKTFHDRRSKEFDVKAIDDLSLKVKSGEAVVLLGPSGCGKTTLLRIIAGLDSPDEGEVYHNGVLLDDIPIESRGIGMVFRNAQQLRDAFVVIFNDGCLIVGAPRASSAIRRTIGEHHHRDDR